jgi:hypothetical protein
MPDDGMLALAQDDYHKYGLPQQLVECFNDIPSDQIGMPSPVSQAYMSLPELFPGSTGPHDRRIAVGRPAFVEGWELGIVQSPFGLDLFESDHVPSGVNVSYIGALYLWGDVGCRWWSQRLVQR